MKTKKIQVAIVTNLIPSYRSDFYKRILDIDDLDITIFCQESIPSLNLKTAHGQFSKNVNLIKSICLNNEKFAWQFLPLFKLLKSYEVIFFYGNPRVFSNVFFSTLLRCFGKKIVIWGQAHTAGAISVTENLRLKWWGLFRYIFLYTDNEVEHLKKLGFRHQYMVGMNNGLNQDKIECVSAQWTIEKLDEWQIKRGIKDRIVLLSCARLVLKNNFQLVIPVLKKIKHAYPKILWCVIGDGEQEQILKDLVKKEGLNEQVIWLGATFDEFELAPWFLSSKVLIHPGAIGLSLLHAFGYKLPVITHDALDNQMPEIAAFNDGRNGFFFKEGNASSLEDKITEVISLNDFKINQMKDSAFQTAKKRFNTKVMVDRFKEMCLVCVNDT